MVDAIMGHAARQAAVAFFNRGYNSANNQANYQAYLGQKDTIEMGAYFYKGDKLSKAGYYDSRTGQYLGTTQNTAKSAAARPQVNRVNKERYETGLAIVQLEKAAASWAEKAQDRNLDPGVRELYRAKARKAIDSAGQLQRALDGTPDNSPAVTPDVEAKAAEYEREALVAEGKSLDTSLNPSLRAYYRSVARDSRTSAAALRGDKIQDEVSQPVNREMSFTIPR